MSPNPKPETLYNPKAGTLESSFYFLVSRDPPIEKPPRCVAKMGCALSSRKGLGFEGLGVRVYGLGVQGSGFRA